MNVNEVTPEFFEDIILFFKRAGYSFVSLSEVHEILASSTKPHKRFVAFTFDDGYIDNYTLAYPVLKKYQVPFTIYVTTNLVDQKAILWWYYLDKLVNENDRISLRFDCEEYEFNLSTDQEKREVFRKIRSMILSGDYTRFDERLEELLSPFFDDLFSLARYSSLSWEQIELLSNDPIATIGAHTVNHHPLSKLTEDKVYEEITRSKQIIEQHIHKNVEHFAYPYGTANEAGTREFRIAKEIGFKTVTTTRPGNIFITHGKHLECLPRLGIQPGRGIDKIELFASGLTHFIKNRGRKIITY